MPIRRPGPPQPTDPRDTIVPSLHEVRLAASWVTIALCTVVIAILQFLAMSSPQLLEKDSSPGFNAIYIGRTSVGMQEALKQHDAGTLPTLDMLANDSAYPTVNTMRTAIIAGELVDADDAAWRLAERDAYSLTDAEQPEAQAIEADLSVLTRIYSSEQYVPTTAETDQLIDRHGWFGELAAGYNLPSTDPQHASPRSSAKSVVIIVILGVVSIGLATLVGVGLLITAIILLATRKIVPRLQSGPAGHRTAYVETLAIFLLAFLVLQVVLAVFAHFTGVDLTALMLVLLVLPIFWPLVCGVKPRRFFEDMGWVAPNGVLREIGAGIAGYIAGLPIIAAGIVATYIVGFMTQLGSDHPIGHEMVSGEGFQAVLLVLTAVVWAPLVEESIFRAALYRHMRNPAGWPSWITATLVSSFIFAAIHPQSLVGIPVLMAIAFVLASMREVRKSLIPSITAHAVHNSLVVGLLLVVLYL